MRVCLINPPRVQPRSWGKPNVFQPIGIAYVAALLERQHEVSIIDACSEGFENVQEMGDSRYRVGLSNEDISNRIKDWSPDVVGINIPFAGWRNAALEVACAVKNVDKDIITILDGQYPSSRPTDCLSNKNIDFVIIGEPEETTLELVYAIEKGNSNLLEDVTGIAFTKNGKITFTNPRPSIENLDHLPFPARHLLPMQKYFSVVKKNPLRGEVCKPWTTLLTSRGCPYECVFCSVHTVMGKRWRARSPENVVKEIEQVVSTYHIRQIDFGDDNITLDRKRMESICNLIVERNLSVEWFTPNGVRADTLDECLLRKMKKSGCKKIRIAPESGVQRVVTHLVKKNMELTDVEKAIVLSRKVGIRVGCFFVIGLIGETKEDIEETIRYAYKLKRLGADEFYFSFATPLYGTELYEQAIRGGFLVKGFSDEALGEAQPLIETPEFTTEDLRELCARAHLINRGLTLDKAKKAIRDPRKAIKFLLLRK